MTHQERIHREQETESERLRAGREVTRNHATAGYGEHCGIYITVKDKVDSVRVASGLEEADALQLISQLQFAIRCKRADDKRSEEQNEPESIESTGLDTIPCAPEGKGFV